MRDSPRESIWLDGLYGQTTSRSQSHDEVVQLQCIASEAAALLTWGDKDMTWLAPRDGQPGRHAVFSDAAIRFWPSIKVLFQLAFHQTAGMQASLLKLAGLDWPVPDLFTLFRGRKP